MRKSAQAPAAPTLAHSITNALKSILDRCAAAGAALAVPGEGGERQFRQWLVTDLLINVLKWPQARIVVGEVFDILLRDAEGLPIVTIETKTPNHRPSREEQARFEERLPMYGTLRAAFLTNGTAWERLDLMAPTGTQQVHHRSTFTLDKATPAEAEAFFEPLVFAPQEPYREPTGRLEVSREHPHVLEILAHHLDENIKALSATLRDSFDGMRSGRAGPQPKTVALSLFDLWCEKSLLVAPSHAAKQIAERFKENPLSLDQLMGLLDELGLPNDERHGAAESISALPPTKQQDSTVLVEILLPGYEKTVGTLCAQTAHVLVARTLLYRIGEDQGMFPQRLSGKTLGSALMPPSAPLAEPVRPALDGLEAVRRSLEDALPTVYKLGEFDWWFVGSEKRAALSSHARAWLADIDERLDQALQRLLKVLDGYFFGRVDTDVWRNLYQHYLPADERQRLGGFYTPDELVHLILDLADFVPEAKGLCGLRFIDPACGSGAFVVTALARLLSHFERPDGCHAQVNEKGLPSWVRAERRLRIAIANLHAVDIHPFAAFLTTLNVMFLLMPLYIAARRKNPGLSLDFHIFAADTLEKHDHDLLEPELFARLNSRVQLSEDSFKRYQEILKVQFDRLFGNPPWGGVLKGRLAPVYDEAKKQRFAREYPAAAQGKYDVYGLFLERALQVLLEGGRFALLTQDTYLDKSWAAGLRAALAGRARLRYIVDLNPFGQLFFKAMNAPCVTVGDVPGTDDAKATCVAVLSSPPNDFGQLGADERRKRVVTTIERVIEDLGAGKGPNAVGFASAARIELSRLKIESPKRWHLTATSGAATVKAEWLSAAHVLEVRQGVTPGGSLDVFLMTKEDTDRLGFESELVHRAIKSRELQRWRVKWNGRAILYPYRIEDDKGVPAFRITTTSSISDKSAALAVRKSGLSDGLDFEIMLDKREKEIFRRKGTTGAAAADLLKHRTALGLVRYPQAAAYLVQHYERLRGRVFEKKGSTYPVNSHPYDGWGSGASIPDPPWRCHRALRRSARAVHR